MKTLHKAGFAAVLLVIFGMGFFASLFTYNHVSALFTDPQRALKSTFASDEEYEKQFLQLEEVALFKEKYPNAVMNRIPMSTSKVIFYHADGPTEYSSVTLHVMEDRNQGGFLMGFNCLKERDVYYTIQNNDILEYLKEYNCFEDEYTPSYKILGNEMR